MATSAAAGSPCRFSVLRIAASARFCARQSRVVWIASPPWRTVAAP